MTDQELMQRIKTEAGALIDAACAGTTLPPAFLAALIANETGAQFAAGGLKGAADAKRFERGVLVALWEVLLDRKATYGAITTKTLLRYVYQSSAYTAAASMLRFDGLATSWGLTQVMGYHVMDRPGGADWLKDPANALKFSVWLISDFASRFHLDEKNSFASLFRCWNGGSPTAQTYDPHYVLNGMARMVLYAKLQ